MARSPAIETDTGIWLALNIGSVDLTDDQFMRLCRDNGDFHFEITAEKELIVMTGSNPETDRKNANITMQLGVWATRDGTGVFFGSSAIFLLPNGARRVPDGAWIRKERWNQLTEQRKSTLTEIKFKSGEFGVATDDRRMLDPLRSMGRTVNRRGMVKRIQKPSQLRSIPDVFVHFLFQDADPI